VRNSHTTDKVVLISRRWPHHAGPSGYDSLGKFVGNSLVAKPIPRFLLPDRHFWRLNRGMLGYDRAGVALELSAVWHMASHRGCIYHVLYGDNCYNYLGRLNGWRNHRVVVSYHYPVSRLAELISNKDPIRRLSAAIIVGTNQRSFFEDALPKERILHVPYAVDTSFFRPPPAYSNREANLCLFAGSHLRDFATLCQIIEDARILAPQLEFALIVLPQDLARFKNVVGNYTVYSQLTDGELLQLYQQASLLIQPLRDATANTVLLEGLSCGLPIVVTDIGAVRDYLDENCARFIQPFNPEEMLAAIVQLMDAPQERRYLAMASRNQALKYDWHKIAHRMLEVYDQILASEKQS